MKRTLIGGAILGASLMFGASPALACGTPDHHPHGGATLPQQSHHPRPHKRHHKPRHEGKPCTCHKSTHPVGGGHAGPPTHEGGHVPQPPRHHHKVTHGHPRPHGKSPHPKSTYHGGQATLTATTLPRTGGTPWVLIFAGGALISVGTAITMARPLRKTTLKGQS